MKANFLVILVVPIALCSFNCKGSKKTASTQTVVKNESQNTANNQASDPNKKVYRFTISFISKGAGIDFQIKQKYDAFITDFETRNNIKVALSKAPWGREGEVDYCFDLAELNKEMIDKFINESKALLSASQRINTGENTNCRGIIK
jgi:hypothetical protein